MAKFEVNEELVRKLADLLQETGLNEIEYEANNQRIRVARGGGAVRVSWLTNGHRRRGRSVRRPRCTGRSVLPRLSDRSGVCRFAESRPAPKSARSELT